MGRARFLAGTVFGGVLGLGLLARAGLGGADGVMLPYRGHLELNGTPVSGVVTLGFDVFNVPSGGTACSSSVLTDVPIHNGEFTVQINVDPPTCVVGQPVYVGTRINAGTAQEVTLTNRQRVYPMLGAYTAGTGDFAIRGNLDLASEARSGSHPTDRPLYVTGNLQAASGAEFRRSDGTQGVGIGSNTIYATGSTTNQDLNLAARGTGVIRAQSPVAAGSITVAGKWRLMDTADDWLRIHDVTGGTYYGGLAAGRLYSNGDTTVNGRLLRTEYQASCPEGSPGEHFSYCCRINVRDGTTACRMANSSTFGGWVNILSPFPNAGADAPYSIACNSWAEGANYPMCCRVGASGSMQCAINRNGSLVGTWESVTAPF